MKQLNIGFIGVGGVAQPHLNNLTKMENVNISAVCDTFADRAQEVGEKFDAAIYTDYKKMLADENLDGCYVCLIPGVHGETELDLVKARVPFYLEKPVHLQLDACQRVLEELEKTPVINSVGYHWRYAAGSQAARKFLQNKKISFIDGYWYGGFVGAPWWRQMKLSGGQLVEQSTHIVDLARYLGGEVKAVYAAASTGAMTDIENYDITDTSVMALKFDSGAVGSVISGCIAEKNGGSKVDLTLKGRGWQAWTNSDKATWESADGKDKSKATSRGTTNSATATTRLLRRFVRATRAKFWPIIAAARKLWRLRWRPTNPCKMATKSKFVVSFDF